MTLSAPFHSLVWSYALQYGVQETDCLANLSPNKISYLLSSNAFEGEQYENALVNNYN